MAALDSLGREIARHREAGGRVVAATHGALPIEQAETLSLDDFPPGPAPEYAW